MGPLRFEVTILFDMSESASLHPNQDQLLPRLMFLKVAAAEARSITE
jgi:hypothetical protein